MSTARINPDSRAALVASVGMTAALALVSFLLSFNGLADAATWANVPAWLAWGVPAYVDGAILVYTVAALVFRSRGESARMSWAALGLFATLSVAANGTHAWTGAPDGLKVALGVILAGLAPVAVLLTTHTIARLVVAPVTAEAPADAHTLTVAPGVAVIRGEVVEPTSTNIVEVHRDPRWTVTGGSTPAAKRTAQPRPASGKSTAARDARIRELAAEELSVRAIADRVGCSKSTVARVLNPSPTSTEAPAVPALA